MARGRGGEETREPGRYAFHYDRGERLRMASNELRNRLGPQSFLRRYRGPLFILLDILVLAGMLGIYLFISGDTSSSSLPGYSLSLSGVAFGNQGLAVLRVTQTERAPRLSGEIVTVEASVVDTTLRKAEKDVLPTKNGQVRTFRFVLEPLPGTAGSQGGSDSSSARASGGASRRRFEVSVTVSAGGITRTVTAPLKPE